MIKKIELNKVARLSDREPFILPDELFLDFSSNYDLTYAKITLRNGTLQKTFNLSKPFEVPNEFLIAGKLSVGVDVYCDGEVVKHFDVLPIKIVETADGNLQAFDLLSQLERRVSELEDNTVKLTNFNILTDKVNEIITKQNEIVSIIELLKKEK